MTPKPAATEKAPERAEKAPALDAPGNFINRELAWLAFNGRVLQEALNPENPLLEREFVVDPELVVRDSTGPATASATA